MKASGSYGMMLGFVFSILVIYDRPGAWIAYWILQTVLSACAAVTIWRRTRLPLMCGGTVIATVIAAAFVAVSIAGYTMLSLPSRWMIAWWISLAVMLVVQTLSWWLYREQYRLWRQHAEGRSMLDLLLMRHIPKLRSLG
jgi:hypothetical protein